MAARPEVTRICFIAPKAYPFFNPDVRGVFGGAEVDLYFLATELAKDKDFEVSFITADYGQERCQMIQGVRIIKSLDFRQNRLIGAIKVWRALRRADAQMYMVKTISPGMFLLALYCRLKKTPFLYRTSNTNSCDGTYLKQHPVQGRIYKWALRTATYVFVQNRMDKGNLEDTTGVCATVIRNAQPLPKLFEQERDTTLWVGRSAPIKRPKLFIDLAEKIPDEKFVMICQRATGDKNYEHLLARAKEVCNLEFIERVGFDEIHGYFQRAKVLVNTSEAEGFPNTFIHACQHATPILSLNVNPDGFLEQYNCGICCDDRFECLVDSLNSILAENRYVELGKNARRYVEQNHDIKRTVEVYKQMFGKLY
jgi:glycosyltransferase involved in cell wall biosynthesis